jgi:uncharacterized protein YcaQ
MAADSLSLTQARKLALRAQGFRQSTRAGTAGWRSLNAGIKTMAALQIDAINTVIRSHYVPLYSRLGAYDRSVLDRKVFASRAQSANRRSHFEYWGHECSILPMEFYPLLRWRMQDARNGIGLYKQLHSLATSNPAFIARIKSTIVDSGAVTSRDLGGARRGNGMWQWSKSKQALEYLFSTGEIASAGRRGFERLYDINERTIPAALLNASVPERKGSQASLLEIAAVALGVATEADLRDYFRISAADARGCIEQLVEDKKLIPLRVDTWKDTAYICPNTVIPRTATHSSLLTPFDPLVWHRQRAERLFGFNFRLEIYVPEKQRKYGYYVMPYLMNGSLVARLDLKSDRQSGSLLVKGAWPEAGVDIGKTAEQLATDLHRLAGWLQLESVKIQRRGQLAKPLQQSLRCMEHC